MATLPGGTATSPNVRGHFDVLWTDAEHPARPQLALRLAGAELELDNMTGCAAALDVAEAGGLGGTPDLLRIRSAMARQTGDWVVMRNAAEAWLQLEPADPDARSALAMALGQEGYYRRAAEIYRPVVDSDPTNAEHWAALGRLILGTRQIPEAKAAFERALDVDPDCAEATFGLARVYTFLGQTEAAEEMCRRTLAVDPANLEAYGQLCEVSGGTLSDAELARLTEETAREGQAADRLAIGLFALGDAHHRRKQREDAFDAWRRANETKQLQHNGARASAYDRGEQERRTAWLSDVFAHENAGGNTGQGAGPVPVFIVGMPRSGTTLIEAAISAHEEAVAGGELSAIPFIFEEFMRWAQETGWSGGEIPEHKLEDWRRRYLGQFREFGLEGARYVTDKQPSNFLAVGLIRRLFPDAPIIHIRRKPIETAFSIYRRNFSRMWPFAHDLGDIAHYYAQHSQLCRHWETSLPDRFTMIQYETLVGEFEPTLRHVLARAGMSWSRNCLEFYQQDRAVMTFSAVQVRKPPSPDHLDSTTPYSAFLRGFDDAVAELGVDPQTGAWRDAAGATADSDSGSAAKEEAGSSARQGFISRLFGRGQGRSAS